MWSNSFSDDFENQALRMLGIGPKCDRTHVESILFQIAAFLTQYFLQARSWTWGKDELARIGQDRCFLISNWIIKVSPGWALPQLGIHQQTLDLPLHTNVAFKDSHVSGWQASLYQARADLAWEWKDFSQWIVIGLVHSLCVTKL